jgi:hypothetical protein
LNRHFEWNVASLPIVVVHWLALEYTIETVIDANTVPKLFVNQPAAFVVVGQLDES